MTDRITIPRPLLEQALEVMVANTTGKDDLEAAISAELAKPEQEESFIPDWANYRQGVADGKAGSPKWHDAPTCAGLWLCNYGILEVVCINQPDVDNFDDFYNAGGRWYGPIPQEGEKT